MNLRIAYLLTGDSKKYVEKLIKEVYKKFGVSFCYSGKQPAHITLKYKFITDKVKEVEKIVGDLCKTIKPSEFEIGGLSNFKKHALILKVKPSREMVRFEKELIRELDKLGISIEGFDRLLYKNFHLGIAHHDIEPKFKEIKGYLKPFNKKFKVKFDKIYLIRKPKNKWMTQKIFRIK